MTIKQVCVCVCVCVLNVYLYAEDVGELTFDEDERIINIEQIDEGWWRGTRELDGTDGLFPANYVELIQD